MRLVVAGVAALFAFAGCQEDLIPDELEDRRDLEIPLACEDFPDFKPKYLPWGKKSLRRPQPLLELNSIGWKWRGPAQGERPRPTLSLIRREKEWDDNDEFPCVPVRGSEGRLVWIGDPGVGELALQWSEGDDSCNNYGLYLFDQSLNQREAESELARVSRSLR